MAKTNGLCATCGTEFETEQEWDLWMNCPNGHVYGLPEASNDYQFILGEKIIKVFGGEHELLLLTDSGKIIKVLIANFDGVTLKELKKEQR